MLHDGSGAGLPTHRPIDGVSLSDSVIVSGRSIVTSAVLKTTQVVVVA